MPSLVPVEVEQAKEPFNEYRLSDGTTLKIKIVLLEVQRHKDQYSPDGNPQYEVKLAPVVAVSAPEELRKGK
jgi:hypothetical protein